MKKVINIYTPQEKMPPSDTQLLVKGFSIGVRVSFYSGPSDFDDKDYWQVEGGPMFETDDVDWWIDLDKLETDIHIKFIRSRSE